MQPIVLERQLTITVPASEFWKLISDTGRSNHAMGLPPIIWSEEKRADRIVVVGTSKYLGVPMRWIEHPFEWIYQKYFRVEREFLKQPLIYSITTGSAIRPLDAARCEVTSLTTIKPRNMAGRTIAHGLIYKMVQDHVALLRQLEAAWHARAEAYFPPAQRVQIDLDTLQARLQRMDEVPLGGGGLENLLHLIQTGRDEDVAQMRPFLLADEWGLERMMVLRMFLYATVAGILELHWDILCPNCRISRDVFRSLRDLQGQAHCETCRIEYNINFDDYVELRFNVHPAIREASHAMFCSLAGPSYNRHVLAQQRIAAHETRTIMLPLAEGGYRIRMLGSEQRCIVAVHPDHTTTQITLEMTSEGMLPLEATLAPGEVQLQVTNTDTREHLWILERDIWGIPFVSAALVTTLPEFRTLFSSEVLAPGLGVSIRNLTFLFSDLKNSTPMYEQIGDSSAYALVRNHFDTLFASIARQHGTIVKTIGDAVMAVFASPAAGIQAALEMIHAVAVDNAARPDSPALTLKVGLHSGPAIAVNANDVLDYFGTTVNAAARAQAVSIGGDIVITSDVYEDPHVQEVLASYPLQLEEFTRDLKGLQHSYILYRLTPQPVDQPEAPLQA